MVCGPPPDSREALIERFNEFLMRAVVQGRGCTQSGSWIDSDTTIAIEKVAAAHPDPDPALIEAARTEFARQLDGTHAAQVQAEFNAFYAPWPDKPFANSVKNAFAHILEFVACPAAYEEADQARSDLDAAQTHSAGAFGRDLIVEQLRLMLEELDVIPELSIELDGGPEDVRMFTDAVETALKQLVNFAEKGQRAHLNCVRSSLRTASKCRPPWTRWEHDFAVITERLDLIWMGLEARPDQS